MCRTLSSSSSACLASAAWNLCMNVLCSPCPLPKGMMGAYGPPYMPMQGPHEGLLSVAPMPPHLPPHHLQQGMPGYPGMPHQGKGPLSQPHLLSHMQSCLSCWRGLPGPRAAQPELHSDLSKPTINLISHIIQKKKTTHNYPHSNM